MSVTMQNNQQLGQLNSQAVGNNSNSTTQIMSNQNKDYIFTLTTSPSSETYQSSSFITSTIGDRNIELLHRLFSKFTKRVQNISSERKYYHSYNVFRPIRSP
jgi:hypothetical protein